MRFRLKSKGVCVCEIQLTDIYAFVTLRFRLCKEELFYLLLLHKLLPFTELNLVAFNWSI